MATPEEIAERVKAIIVDQLGVNLEEVTPQASFIEDLGADSLDIVELIMALEEEYEMEIPDEDAEKIGKTMMAFIGVHRDLPDLNSYWKANQGQLDKLKDSHPDLYENVRTTFANIKANFSKE